jgi:hypothetical protein
MPAQKESYRYEEAMFLYVCLYDRHHLFLGTIFQTRMELGPNSSPHSCLLLPIVKHKF